MVSLPTMHHSKVVNENHITWLLLKGELDVGSIRMPLNAGQRFSFRVTISLSGYFCGELCQLKVEPCAHCTLVPGEHRYSRLLNFTERFR